jgi:hypothetical protein
MQLLMPLLMPLLARAFAANALAVPQRPGMSSSSMWVMPPGSAGLTTRLLPEGSRPSIVRRNSRVAPADHACGLLDVVLAFYDTVWERGYPLPLTP